jgi:putative sigma-54 modulation protein
MNAEKNVAEKNVAEKNVAEKNVAEKNVAEKNVAEKNAAENLNGHAVNGHAAPRVQFTLRHTTSHPHLEKYAREAITQFDKYFHNGITDCHIILDHQNNDTVHNKLSEITVHVHHHTFVSKESAETYEKAIDLCVEHLCKQLQKHKEKVRHL